jgi:hypothetical protein
MSRRDLVRPLLVGVAVAIGVGGAIAIYAASLSGDASGPDTRSASPPGAPSEVSTVGEPTPGEEAEATRTTEHGTSRRSGDRAAGGRIDPRASTLPASTSCEPVQVQVHGESPRRITQQAPPVPRLEARRERQTILVTYEFLAMPSECEPVAIQVTANSVDKLDNIRSASTDGAPIPLNGHSATVRVPVPQYGPAPYEARASAYTRQGLGSPVTTIPVR